MIVNNTEMTFECVNTHETESEEEAYGLEFTSHSYEPLPQGGAAPAEHGFPWCWPHLVAMLMGSGRVPQGCLLPVETPTD